MPQRSPATNATGPLAPGAVLRLDEEMLDITELAAIDAAALDGALADHSISLSMPGKLDREGTEILRLWPAKIWCIGPLIPEFTALAQTDIGHGKTILRLRGVGAFYLVAAYSSTNLRAASLRRKSAARCMIGLYDVTLWWANTRDLRVAVDRSLAQSFVDHLRDLAARHSNQNALE